MSSRIERIVERGSPAGATAARCQTWHRRLCLPALLCAIPLAVAACTPSSPVALLTGSGGEEFAHAQGGLVIPPVGTVLPSPGGDGDGAPAAAAGIESRALAPVPDRSAEPLPSVVQQTAQTPAPVAPPPAPPPEPPPLPIEPVAGAPPAILGNAFWIQAGVFAVQENLQRARDRLQALGSLDLRPVTLGGLAATQVMLGPYVDVDSAQQVLPAVRGAGYPEAWIRRL
ncbi:MAG: SPOR domain-containing protein [Azospirillaceae bacterium]